MAIGSPQWMYSSGDYELEQSLRFNDDDSAYLSWTPSSAGNLNKWTWSGWVKRGNITNSSYPALFGAYISSSVRDVIRFTDTDELSLQVKTASATYTKTSNAKYRDPSAWLHIIVVWDSANATASHRLRMYVNGSEITLTGTDVASGSPNSCINNANSHFLGARSSDGNPSAYHDGFLGEVNFIDGQALTPADFGETGTYGEWKPVKYSGTYGNNGFYLPFKQDYTVEGFSATLYKGTGGNATAPLHVGGVGFQPDMVWTKCRTDTIPVVVFDAVRGENKQLDMAVTDAEVSRSATAYEFETDGFSVSTVGNGNNTGQNYVAWSWDMGGSNATNTDGSITSTVRANPTYGQSIVSYTGNGTAGATVGHGLSSAPDMVIVKSRDSVHSWSVGHVGLGTNEVLLLNSSNDKRNFTTDFSNGGVGARGATTFTLGAGTVDANNVNTNNEGFIAYCFHSVTGYSKFGSYSGTGSSGNSITTGFRPAFVMIKCTTNVAEWIIVDSTRNPTNPVDKQLFPDVSDAEVTSPSIQFDSNGFTLLAGYGNINNASRSYIYMAFADTREYAYWLDQSGNNNDWTSNNLTESDISVDSPTNNFCTMNPLSGNGTFSEGNLKVVTTVAGSAPYKQMHYGTISASSGKYYWEVVPTDVSGVLLLGSSSSQPSNKNQHNQYGSAGTNVYNENGDVDTGSTDRTDGASYGVGDIIGVALDMDNNRIYFAKNNTWANSANPSTGSNSYALSNSNDNEQAPIISNDSTGSNVGAIFNFGQDSSFAGNKTAQGNQDGNDIGDFYYTPPTGFLALCTKNLPDVDVVPSEHFNTVLWTGTTSVDRDITGIGFDPSLVWIKSRSDAYEQLWFDKVRGAGKRLMSHNTNAESTNDSTLNAFITDGFTLGNGSTVDLSVNGNTSKTYVAWNWKANGSGSSNTDGSITSTVSANTDAGFSIVSWTQTGYADSIGHGLNKTPDLIILKSRSATTANWWVYTNTGGTGKGLVLNNTSAMYTSSDVFPTVDSTKFIQGSEVYSGGSNVTYIAYCFHSVDGYSKVGSYTGNGNADGTFVYTGFRPAFVICKMITDAGEGWIMRDNARDPFNVVKNHLNANQSYADSTASQVYADFLSNGFKQRANNSINNGSGKTYIYIAFAETPFKNSNAR